jgi:hypothetical protein
LVPDPEGAKLTIRAVSYRSGYWEAVASEAHDQARIVLDLAHPARVGNEIGMRFTGGRVLPAESVAPLT